MTDRRSRRIVRGARPGWAAVMTVLLVAPVSAFAHDVNHRVDREGAAVVVTVGYADGGAFNYESYEVYRPGETTPYQVGRTDALGRVTFLPDVGGTWRVKAFSADGHGLDITVETGPEGLAAENTKGVSDRLTRLLGGLVIFAAAFGLMGLLARQGRGGG